MGIGEREGVGGNVGKVIDGNGLKYSGDLVEYGEMINVLLIGLYWGELVGGGLVFGV